MVLTNFSLGADLSFVYNVRRLHFELVVPKNRYTFSMCFGFLACRFRLHNCIDFGADTSYVAKARVDSVGFAAAAHAIHPRPHSLSPSDLLARTHDDVTNSSFSGVIDALSMWTPGARSGNIFDHFDANLCHLAWPLSGLFFINGMLLEPKWLRARTFQSFKRSEGLRKFRVSIRRRIWSRLYIKNFRKQ